MSERASERVIEPMLDASQKERMAIFPIQHHDVWDMYQKSLASFWTVGEVDLSRDGLDWDNLLTDPERTFLKNILAFFSSSDTIVNINLAERFLNEVHMLEAKYFYAFQMAIENIHSEMYALLIDTYIRDPIEKNKLFDAIQHIPCVKKKADWCFRWIYNRKEDDGINDNRTDNCNTDNDNTMPIPFAQRLIAFAIVEGVFFSGAFASIFWQKEKGRLPGLAFSNELISRDEALHVEFAVLLYSKVVNRVDEHIVHEMFRDAVDVEKEFILKSIPCSMLGMNSILMSQYIEFVADRLMVQLGYTKMFHASNPFPFMERISIQNKTNFFEARVAEYSKANVTTLTSATSSKDATNKYAFELNEDF
jgi:ribonucleotide reductase beta subunit family protein with ferritin-like domain